MGRGTLWPPPSAWAWGLLRPGRRGSGCQQCHSPSLAPLEGGGGRAPSSSSSCHSLPPNASWGGQGSCLLPALRLPGAWCAACISPDLSEPTGGHPASLPARCNTRGLPAQGTRRGLGPRWPWPLCPSVRPWATRPVTHAHLFLCSPADAHLPCFQDLAVTNKATLSIHVPDFVWTFAFISLGSINNLGGE